MQNDVVVVAMTRTAVGRMGGSLSDVPSIKLATFIITEVLKKVEFDHEEIDELIIGNVENRSDESCLARWAGQREKIGWGSNQAKCLIR